MHFYLNMNKNTFQFFHVPLKIFFCHIPFTPKSRLPRFPLIPLCQDSFTSLVVYMHIFTFSVPVWFQTFIFFLRPFNTVAISLARIISLALMTWPSPDCPPATRTCSFRATDCVRGPQYQPWAQWFAEWSYKISKVCYNLLKLTGLGEQTPVENRLKVSTSPFVLELNLFPQQWYLSTRRSCSQSGKLTQAMLSELLLGVSPIGMQCSHDISPTLWPIPRADKNSY